MDRLRAMRQGQPTAALVEGVLAEPQRLALLDRLAELSPTAIAPADSPLGGVRQWGAMLGPTPDAPRGPDPELHRRRNRALWDGLGEVGLPVITGVLRALGALTAQPVEVVPGGFLASVRRMPEGCGAPLHRDRYPESAAYAGLRRIADLDHQLVWYLMLRASPRGGALRVLPGLAEDGPRPGPAEVHEVPEGALLIHPGAAFWHEVEAPEGGDRITLGGVCAPRLDGSGWWVSA